MKTLNISSSPLPFFLPIHLPHGNSHSLKSGEDLRYITGNSKKLINSVTYLLPLVMMTLLGFQSGFSNLLSCSSRILSKLPKVNLSLLMMKKEKEIPLRNIVRYSLYHIDRVLTKVNAIKLEIVGLSAFK